MTADPVLLLAWLVLAHLVADFVLQTPGIVAAKTSSGGRAIRGLLVHGAAVALTMVPFAVAFGANGLIALVWVTLSHVLVDRTKIVLTRRAESRAIAEANRRHEGRAPAAGLGRAWTPLPAAYFILDQAAHLGALGVAWAVWLATIPLTDGWVAAVAGLAAAWPPDTVHGVALGTAVVGCLVISNSRAGAIFVATLVRPLEVAVDLGPTGGATPVAGEAAGIVREGAPVRSGSPSAARSGRRWSFRVGPFAGRVAEDLDAAPAPAPDVTAIVAGERVALPPPAQVGATIGVIERLLIVAFVLVGADAAIGFVVGAKTIARFKQLDDRDFAEYYLLGTLASVSIAILTAIVARAALNA